MGEELAVDDVGGPVRYQAPSTTMAFRAFLITGRTFVALLSAAVLVVTWYGWSFYRQLNDGIATTDVIAPQVAAEAGRKPLDGAIDILLVGIDSRTDAQGNELPKEVLQLLNGGRPDGEANTDTMILVHIPVDGTRAVAISFPRDSYVEIADGWGKHKLNSAYALQRNEVISDLGKQNVTDPARIRQESSTAGRKTLIKTIEDLTGGSVKIDRYAEVNLLSFYEVTQAIGGVEVCLKEATSDTDSGADFQAGPQVIEGRRALQFVRQRGGLPGGDLDRIVRQQVFIGALAKKVLSSGTLTDTEKLTDLVDAVKKSVVLSQGWDVTEFAEQMQGLVGGNIQFRTIPVGDPMDTYGDGNVLPVNPAQVRKFITELATDPPPSGSSSATPTTTTTLPAPPNSAITVQVFNASGVPGTAASVLNSLAAKGFVRGAAQNAAITDTTVVRHAPGEEGSARKVATEVGPGVTVEEDRSVPKGQVRVFVGTDYSSQDEDVDTQNAPGQTSAPTSTTPPITAGGVVCVN